jgi:catechol 2,3-dioxygenase-like lactoylglutathione lyase family enzyme
LGDALFIRDETGFNLALTPAGHAPRLGEDGFHVGFQFSERNDIHAMLDALRTDGVPIVEVDDEPDFQAFKCLDPDGYLIEVSWTAPAPGA